MHAECFQEREGAQNCYSTESESPVQEQQELGVTTSMGVDHLTVKQVVQDEPSGD